MHRKEAQCCVRHFKCATSRCAAPMCWGCPAVLVTFRPVSRAHPPWKQEHLLRTSCVHLEFSVAGWQAAWRHTVSVGGKIFLCCLFFFKFLAETTLTLLLLSEFWTTWTHPQKLKLECKKNNSGLVELSLYNMLKEKSKGAPYGV